MFHGRYKIVQCIKNQCMLAKMQISEKIDMEIDKSILQNLVTKWVAPELRKLVK